MGDLPWQSVPKRPSERPSELERAGHVHGGGGMICMPFGQSKKNKNHRPSSSPKKIPRISKCETLAHEKSTLFGTQGTPADRSGAHHVHEATNHRRRCEPGHSNRSRPREEGRKARSTIPPPPAPKASRLFSAAAAAARSFECCVRHLINHLRSG